MRLEFSINEESPDSSPSPAPIEEVRETFISPPSLDLTPGPTVRREEEGEGLDTDSVKLIEDIAKCLKGWKKGVKTFEGEEIRETECRLCESGEEDFKYSEPVELVRKDRKYVIESLAAVIQEVRGGKEKPWKDRCDFNLPRAAMTKERKSAMMDHGLLVEFENT
jgi:hypothetical protein